MSPVDLMASESTNRVSPQVLDDAEEDEGGCLEDEASLNERRLVSRYGVWGAIQC